MSEIVVRDQQTASITPEQREKLSVRIEELKKFISDAQAMLKDLKAVVFGDPSQREESIPSFQIAQNHWPVISQPEPCINVKNFHNMSHESVFVRTRDQRRIAFVQKSPSLDSEDAKRLKEYVISVTFPMYSKNYIGKFRKDFVKSNSGTDARASAPYMSHSVGRNGGNYAVISQSRNRSGNLQERTDGTAFIPVPSTKQMLLFDTRSKCLSFDDWMTFERNKLLIAEYYAAQQSTTTKKLSVLIDDLFLQPEILFIEGMDGPNQKFSADQIRICEHYVLQQDLFTKDKGFGHKQNFYECLTRGKTEHHTVDDNETFAKEYSQGKLSAEGHHREKFDSGQRGLFRKDLDFFPVTSYDHMHMKFGISDKQRYITGSSRERRLGEEHYHPFVDAFQKTNKIFLSMKLKENYETTVLPERLHRFMNILRKKGDSLVFGRELLTNFILDPSEKFARSVSKEDFLARYSLFYAENQEDPPKRNVLSINDLSTNVVVTDSEKAVTNFSWGKLKECPFSTKYQNMYGTVNEGFYLELLNHQKELINCFDIQILDIPRYAKEYNFASEYAAVDDLRKNDKFLIENPFLGYKQPEEEDIRLKNLFDHYMRDVFAKPSGPFVPAPTIPDGATIGDMFDACRVLKNNEDDLLASIPPVDVSVDTNVNNDAIPPVDVSVDTNVNNDAIPPVDVSVDTNVNNDAIPSANQ